MNKLSSPKQAYWLGILTAVVSTATVIYAIYRHPPTEIRQLRLDRLRTQDLQAMARSVQTYTRNHNALPPDITTLASDRQQGSWRDPETGNNYTYEVNGSQSYKLCAVFARKSTDNECCNEQWEHLTGLKCFEMRISKL
jgi:hypothetical protein